MALDARPIMHRRPRVASCVLRTNDTQHTAPLIGAAPQGLSQNIPEPALTPQSKQLRQRRSGRGAPNTHPHPRTNMGLDL
jgi:hypothetical protein